MNELSEIEYFICSEESKVCHGNKCLNGGKCKDTGNDTYSCLCPTGFTGANCQCKYSPLIV